MTLNSKHTKAKLYTEPRTAQAVVLGCVGRLAAILVLAAMVVLVVVVVITLAVVHAVEVALVVVKAVALVATQAVRQLAPAVVRMMDAPATAQRHVEWTVRAVPVHALEVAVQLVIM